MYIHKRVDKFSAFCSSFHVFGHLSDVKRVMDDLENECTSFFCPISFANKQR